MFTEPVHVPAIHEGPICRDWRNYRSGWTSDSRSRMPVLKTATADTEELAKSLKETAEQADSVYSFLGRNRLFDQ